MATTIEKLGKAAQNKKIKREALLNTAFDLFTKNGITNTSISNIVEKAGVAKGTFYLYFKDKYDLRDRLIRHKASQIFGRSYGKVERKGFQTLEDKMTYLAGDIIDQLSRDKILVSFLSKNLSWGVLKHQMETIHAPAFEDEVNIAEKFREAIAASRVKYKNPEIMLYMIIELVGAASYSSISEGDPLPIDELQPYLMDSIRAIMHSMEVQE